MMTMSLILPPSANRLFTAIVTGCPKSLLSPPEGDGFVVILLEKPLFGGSGGNFLDSPFKTVPEHFLVKYDIRVSLLG